jgi:hypothetical protein
VPKIKAASILITSFAILFLLGSAMSQSTAKAQSLLTRHYKEGQILTYIMKGSNAGWNYEITANGTVKKDVNGKFTEEYAWSDLKSNAPMTLNQQSLSFRQVLSLDPAVPPSIPDLSKVQTYLIGPITDLLTVYSDLWLAARQSMLTHAGDHAYVKLGTPASWADGNYVILGEDSIDFDFLLEAVDDTGHTATLLARHVPPQSPQVKLPAAWMQAHIADTANNWVEVKKENNGKYDAEVGKETFDVEIKISLEDGRILSATIDNPVKAIKRECTDAALTTCTDPEPIEIRRQIELRLIP